MRQVLEGRSAALSIAFSLLAVACASSGPEETTTSTTSTFSTTQATVGGSTTEATTTTTTKPTTGEKAAIEAQIDDLIEVTEDLRELTFLTPPTVTLVTDEELAQRLRDQIDEDLDPDDLARDTALQVLLGLIEPGTDLLALYTDLYSEQVAGYYDRDAEEIVVPAGESLNALQKVTLVHELTHALTDQHFGFSDRLDLLDEQQLYDQLSAFQAVVEGDATFTEILYVTELPAGEQQQALTLLLDQDTSVYDRTPRFIQELLLFPYLQGQGFTEALWGTDTGFDGVNAVYDDPPITTEQIYHPMAYSGGEGGAVVSLPATSLTRYTADEESVWGELSFRVMFQQVLEAPVARDAANGWGGDAYRVLWDGKDVVLVLVYEGDTAGDDVEMYDALVAYVEAAMAAGDGVETGDGVTFRGDDYAYVAMVDGRVLFVAASDPVAGEELTRSIAGT